MPDHAIELTPAELVNDAHSIREYLGEQKLTQIIFIGGKKYCYKRDRTDNWYHYENSRNLAKKYPKMFPYKESRVTAEQKAREALNEYKSFRISFGAMQGDEMISPGVAEQLVLIGNQLKDDNSSANLNAEEKEFVSEHIYTEYIPQPLHESLGIDLNDLTYEQFVRLRDTKYEDLRDYVRFEKNLKDSIIKNKEQLREHYVRCAEAALCGLVPDMQIFTFFDQFGHGFTKKLGFVLTEGAGFGTDGTVKWYDFDKPELDLFTLEQKSVIRQAIDDHKKRGEYAAQYNTDGNIQFATWYVELVAKFSGEYTEDNMERLKVVFSVSDEIGTPYLDSLRQLVGAPRYGDTDR